MAAVAAAGVLWTQTSQVQSQILAIMSQWLVTQSQWGGTSDLVNARTLENLVVASWIVGELCAADDGQLPLPVILKAESLTTLVQSRVDPVLRSSTTSHGKATKMKRWSSCRYWSSLSVSSSSIWGRGVVYSSSEWPVSRRHYIVT